MLKLILYLQQSTTWSILGNRFDAPRFDEKTFSDFGNQKNPRLFGNILKILVNAQETLVRSARRCVGGCFFGRFFENSCSHVGALLAKNVCGPKSTRALHLSTAKNTRFRAEKDVLWCIDDVFWSWHRCSLR